MATIPRLSTNTSLMNARIFDDDAWDENDRPKVQIKSEPDECSTKKELKVEPQDENMVGICKDEIKYESSDDMKQEDFENEFSESDSDDNFREESGYNSHLKTMVNHESSTPNAFRETSSGKVNVKPKFSFTPARIKQEAQTNDTFEEGEIRDSFLDTSIFNQNKDEFGEACHRNKTPDSSLENNFNDSPYNKEMFNVLRIKEETPVKEGGSGTSKNSLKMGVKRAVFSRHSPYKKDECDTFKKRASIKSRLDTSQKRPERKPEETDPTIIARREKQIEYGKNTVGYDNYIKTVPVHERKLEDPKTPPKYKKYSRRAWEGLIKQWRIKLHKYDPSGSSDIP